MNVHHKKTEIKSPLNLKFLRRDLKGVSLPTKLNNVALPGDDFLIPEKGFGLLQGTFGFLSKRRKNKI